MIGNMHYHLAEFFYSRFFGLYWPMYYKFKSIHDHDEIFLYNQVIKKGDVVFDIGANIGFSLSVFSSRVGDGGIVHAFEPDKTNFNYLRFLNNHIFKYNNVKLINKAVSDRCHMIELYKSYRTNVDHRTYPVSRYKSKSIVEAIDIDGYVNGGRRVDFIKLDVQGYEFFALQGMKQTISANNDMIIMSELWPSGLKDANVTVDQFLSLIHSMKLNVYLIKQKKIIPLTQKEIKMIHDLKGDKSVNIILTRKRKTF